jgi:predicted nucleic acid-binding Zn ribbon protein
MNHNEKPLKDVLREFVEVYRLKGKLNQYRLIDRWEPVVGKVIAKHTKGLSINRKTLYVEMDSSIVRNEVYLLKSMIIEELNKGFGEKIIDHIVFK